MQNPIERKRRAVAVLVLTACLLMPAASQAARPSTNPRSDTAVGVQREPGDRWLERVPRAVRRLIVSIQEMLEPPKP